MTNVEEYIIFWFFIATVIVLLCGIFWPSESSKIKKAFFKKMKINQFGIKVIDNAPTTYTHNSEIINERNMIRIYIKGDGLYYKGIRDGNIGLVDVSCQTFKKR